MSIPRESQIQELLADNITVLEPGLELRYREYPLANAHGTRGRIDLLAKDRNGMWVVIEIKRMGGGVDTALHQVAKYIELLCREEHLPPDQVRAMIVSVEWHQLLVPVSNISRSWFHDLRGYQLSFAPDGSIAKADHVKFLDEPFVHRLSPIHFLYFFNSPDDRDLGWRQIVHVAGASGSDDLIGVDLRYIGPPHRVQAPYALYLALGRIDPESTQYRPFVSASDDDSEDEEIEPVSVAGGLYTAEDNLLQKICSVVFGVTSEQADPGKFTHLLENHNWTIETIRRSGAYSRAQLRDDNELVCTLAGFDGDSPIQFAGNANPKIRSRWQSFRASTQPSLAGNEDWARLVGHWLDTAEACQIDSEVALTVYNPCDLLQALIFGWPDRVEEYAPRVRGYQRSIDGKRERLLYGELYWDGTHVRSLGWRVQTIYKHPQKWWIARYGGDTWFYDQMLLNVFGLRYVLIDEVVGSSFESADTSGPSLLITHEGQVRRITPPSDQLQELGWEEAHPLDTFIAKHHLALDALVRQYRAALGINPYEQ